MFSRTIRQFFPAPQDMLHLSLTLILPPAIFFYEILFILPAINASIIHIYIGFFLLHNIGGNAICGILSAPNSYLRNVKPSLAQDDWKMCEKCDRLAPPRSWHCSVCKNCVLKRDHHCNFFGQCIGYHNHRYFYMFVLHAFLATSYAFYFNFFFMINHFKWDEISWIGLTKFIFPLAGVAFHFSEESFHILYFVITLIASLFCGFLLIYHGRVLLRGQITPESKKQFVAIYNLGWKRNIIEILGERWYLTWISPLFMSQLPGDGLSWPTKPLESNDMTDL